MWTRRTAPLAFVLILAGVACCTMGSGMSGYDDGTYLFAPSRGDLIVPGLAAIPVLLRLVWLGFIIARAIRDDPDVT